MPPISNDAVRGRTEVGDGYADGEWVEVSGLANLPLIIEWSGGGTVFIHPDAYVCPGVDGRWIVDGGRGRCIDVSESDPSPNIRRT